MRALKFFKYKKILTFLELWIIVCVFVVMCKDSISLSLLIAHFSSNDFCMNCKYEIPIL